MNQKAYSVLFCALLASTFVHELRAKGVAPVSSRLEVFERAASTEVCELKCSFNLTTPSFGLTVQVVQNVLVIANLSANAALLIDASAQIIVLLNGTSGAGVAIDISAQTGVYIKGGLWVSSKTTIEVFIKSLSGGLKGIFNISGAEKFKVSTVSSAILVVINEIIVKLVFNIQEDVRLDAKLGLQIFIAIGGGLVVLLRGSLNGLLNLFGSLVISIKNDLAGLLNVLQGFSQIVVKVSGSLTALIEAGVVFDLIVILGASNGLEVLIDIILQIGAVIDIGAALGGILNNAESLFRLIAQLGGNVSYGISGVFLIVADIVALINGNATVEVVINAIIQYVAYSSILVTADFTVALNETLKGFLSVVKRINASSSLSGLVSIVQKLIEGKLVIGGVNISAIINRLIVGVSSGGSSLLEVVVFVVLQLQAVVEIGLLISYLAILLIFRLYSAIGVIQLIALGIKIRVQFGVGNILRNLLANAFSLVLALLTGNFYDALVRLPGIGIILEALNAAVVAASGGKVSLKSILNVGSLFRNLILGLIQFVTGFSLGVSSSIIAQVKALLESSVSVGAAINVNVTVGGSFSFSG